MSLKSILALAAALAGAHAAVAAQDVLPLRVCADPGNMPLSNNKGEGFQNKVAQVLAKAMGTTVEYYWYPYYGRGLVRSTLNAGQCDVLMDVPSDFEMALTTKPYFKSTFVLVHRNDRQYHIGSLDDPILKTLQIGVFQSSPAREALRSHGVLEKTKVQYVFFDSYSNTKDYPGKQVEQVVDGTLDAAEAWGPIAGYYAVKKKAPLTLLPMNRLDDGIPLEFKMSLGVRRADKDLKQRLDRALEASRDEIGAILADYGVPLVRCEDCVVSGDLPEHGPYTAIEKAHLQARGDHPESSAQELAATKSRLAEGGDASKELVDAVLGNDPDRVRFLLDRGADPNKVAELDYNALQTAVREGHLAIAQILLERGADIDRLDKDGWSPLMFAVYRNNPDMIALLLRKGANKDVYGTSGWSALSVAITYGDAARVKQLLDAGANVNAANAAGYTPVMFATAKSADGVLELLIERGAKVGAANKAGITSLMLAAAEDNADAARLLLAAGADTATKDAEGQTALEIARAKRNAQVEALLSERPKG
jgi:quinoprotein dehydrogenase-associated probable ABC transporter substrate-binding protein